MDRLRDIRRVFFWTLIGVIGGMIVGAPLAHFAELRDPALDTYVIGSPDPWGSPGGPLKTGTVNAAARTAMSASIGLGLLAGLLVGLARTGFFASRRASPDQSNGSSPTDL